MRTTLAIGDEILAAAKHLAAGKQRTVARQGLAPGTRGMCGEPNGISRLSGRKSAARGTLERVNQLRGADE